VGQSENMSSWYVAEWQDLTLCVRIRFHFFRYVCSLRKLQKRRKINIQHMWKD